MPSYLRWLLAAALWLASTVARASELEGLEAWADGAFAAGMDEHEIPGAVFVVVRGGTTVLAKGYGVADLDTARPIVPERTVFRVASVSKVFTATAVMQLVADGRLDLHADIRTYLDADVTGHGGTPLTLHHLLTHTPGFDDPLPAARGVEGANAEPLPLGEFLHGVIPSTFTAPGDVISYSNVGYGLAGLIVERVAGEPFADYVERHILAPLGMAQSSFERRSELVAELATSYYRTVGPLEPVPPVVGHNVPAGQLIATASDMGRFMSAHLAIARGEGDLLSPAAAATMHRRQFTHHEALPGWTYGFWEREEHGLRCLVHGGSTEGFGSMLVLVPEHGLGLFVSATRLEHHFDVGIVEGFFDTFFPAELPASRVDVDLSAYVGSYRSNRLWREGFTKVGALFNELRVVAGADATLSIVDPTEYFTTHGWIPVGHHQFVDPQSGRKLGFRVAIDGEATHLFSDPLAPAAWDRVPWWESAHLHGNLFALTALAFLAAALGIPASVGVARLRGRPTSSTPVRRVRWLTAGLAWSHVLSIGFFGAGFTLVYWQVFTLGIPWWTVLALTFPLIGVGLTVGLVGAMLGARRDASWTRLGRAFALVVLLASLIQLVLLEYWNLLGYQLG